MTLQIIWTISKIGLILTHQNFMSKTTTTTTAAPKEVKINLTSFLDMKGLTRAERMYYTKHNAHLHETRTVKEWEKSIKFIH